MKTIIICLLTLAPLGFLPSCTFVESQQPATTRTTTSELVPSPYGTVETKTTRTY